MRYFAVISAGLFAAAGLAAGLLGSAAAADLPVSAPVYTKAPPPVVAYNWTGCFIGGHIGGGVGEDRTTNLAGASTDFNATGILIGGQVGCDYQFASNWVIGVEGRAAWSGLENTHASTVRNLVTGVVLPSQFRFRNDYLASATARLGYSFADRWLVFGRGGAAWTREKADDAFTNLAGVNVDPAATFNRTGWTAGVGVEWAFAPHWSATLEYNYYDFGSHSAVLVDPANGTFVNLADIRDRLHAATIGLNYRF